MYVSVSVCVCVEERVNPKVRLRRKKTKDAFFVSAGLVLRSFWRVFGENAARLRFLFWRDVLVSPGLRKGKNKKPTTNKGRLPGKI